ncbi:MAG: hypothetical protein R3B36_21155 [Polyangiaceae bacterium]
MSEKEKSKPKASQPSYELPSSWQNTWKMFAGVGVVGAAITLGAGMSGNTERMAFSWLFAFITCLTVALGAMFFVLIQRLTSAGWSVTVRRTAEFFAHGLIVFPVLFVPVLLFMGHIFPWLGHHGAGHEGGGHAATTTVVREARADELPADPHAAKADPHGAAPAAHAAAPAAHGDAHGAIKSGHMPDPHAVIHGELMEKKAPYLNKNFFIIRAVIYFLIWIVLATRLFGLSTKQDSSKSPELTLQAQRLAPPATFLFGLSLTFAAFDWIMSLEPAWFSTIFGVNIFAASVVSSLAVIILVTLQLRDSSAPIKSVITIEHYHDLGKLMFGFLVFWAYIGFSQFMLIWYAALPEETTWYHHRWDAGPWELVSKIVLVGHFVLPFFWLISRNFKRNLGRLKVGAAWLLLMHIVDIYWFVMPNFRIEHQNEFAFHWLDATSLLAVGGIYLAVVFHRMTQHPMIPVGDPRLARSVAFQNA